MKIFLLGGGFFSFIAGISISVATGIWVEAALDTHPNDSPIALGAAAATFAVSAGCFMAIAMVIETQRVIAGSGDIGPHLRNKRRPLVIYLGLALASAATGATLLGLPQ